MKNYTISTGAELTYDGNAYTAEVNWCGKSITTVFTPDEGTPDVSADASVSLFEKAYARKEYYLMLVLDFVKAKLVEELTDEEYETYREHAITYFGTRIVSIFDTMLAEVELEVISFGNEGEIEVALYDYSRDASYTAFGYLDNGFTNFEVGTDY